MTHATSSNPDGRRPHVAVVGGGLAGLAAACFAARGGADVTLIESVSELGGRARTRDADGFRFNMGPHALYRNGPAEGVLAELGCLPTGSAPPLGRALGRLAGSLHALPGGPVSLLTTSLVGARDKLALGRLLARFPKLDPAPWQTRTVEAFLRETLPSERSRQVVAALIRLATYGNAPEQMSAGAAITQVQGALGNGVRYLDGGWQSMVDGLARTAERAGVRIRSGVRVRAIEERPDLQVRLRDGSAVPADAVVLAMGPGEASALVGGGTDPLLAERAERSLPVRAACLDVALSHLPDPRRSFMLGIDEPTYASLHSVGARGMAPEGGAAFQCARYLAPDEKPERGEVTAHLEAGLDALQPGWRDHVVSQKLLLDVRVAHALPTAEHGGLPGRPPVDALARTRPGILLAGDWIGPTGWLADGPLASGRDAGRAAAHFARSGGHG